MDKKAFVKYLSALILFGLNGIVASHIALSSYEIVFLRTLIGSVLLIVLFLIGKGKFHIKENIRDTIFIVLSGVAMGTSWMFLYEAYQQIGVSLSSLLYYCGPVIVMILSPLIFREKLTPPKIVGFIIVLVGVVFVNGNAVGDMDNLCGYLEPLSAVIFAAVLLGEKMTVIQIIGAVCIIGGAMIGELVHSNKKSNNTD